MKNVVMAISLLLSLSASAGTFNIADYNKRNPDFKATSSKPTPISGVHEITFEDGGVGYMDDGGRYLFVGGLFDLASKQLLTPTRSSPAATATAERINIDSLPLYGAITVKRGNGRRRLVVFSDPDCPHCRQLEQALAGITDITLYIFPYPLMELHPEAFDRAAGALCHSEPVKGWQLAVAGGAGLPKPSERCRKKIEAIQKLGKLLSVTVTPTLINSAGFRANGALTTKELLQWIQ